MPRVVVLGTGTGIGKTFFTAALARALAGSAPSDLVLAVKPIETGLASTRDGRPAGGSDAAVLEAASTSPAPRPHPRYAFEEPLSPHLAARRERRRISLGSVASWVSDITIQRTAWLLIETAGAALSPLSATETNLDLARALQPAIWILVAPDALGVLHDVRATWFALRRLARVPDFLVLSAARAPDASTGTNAAELARLGLPRPAAVLARDERSPDALRPLVRRLRRAAR